MEYHEWHQRPGYYGDVTRHFDRHDAVLDVGCGTGWFATEFDSYVGVDTDAKAVEHAQRLGRDVRLAGGTTLDFDDETFDGVILKDVLEHVSDPASLVLEVGRVLRRGGTAFASSPDAQRTVWHDYTHVRPYTKRSMMRLWEDQGFEAVKVSYESVAPGSSRVAKYSKTHRRHPVYRAAGHVRFLPRNVWILARKV